MFALRHTFAAKLLVLLAGLVAAASHSRNVNAVTGARSSVSWNHGSPVRGATGACATMLA